MMMMLMMMMMAMMMMVMMMFEDADYVDSGCVGDGDDSDMMIDNDD